MTVLPLLAMLGADQADFTSPHTLIWDTKSMRCGVLACCVLVFEITKMLESYTMWLRNNCFFKRHINIPLGTIADFKMPFYW